VVVSALPEDVWAALPLALQDAFDHSRARHVAAILRCDDLGDGGASGDASKETLAGFHVARADAPRELALEGRHRFSRYRLTFEIEPRGAGSRIRAVTHAEFPGFQGRLYRALVVGSGGHRIMTRRILISIARRAERVHAHRKEEA
jgi:hypothetical protein